MDIKAQPGCPLCWDNGLLKGGEVIGETEQLYAYGYIDDDGNLTYAQINTKCHHADMRTLKPLWGAEFASLYDIILKRMGDQSHNGYWNHRKPAGQTIPGHWHTKVLPRYANLPSSGKGLALLIQEYDEARMS